MVDTPEFQQAETRWAALSQCPDPESAYPPDWLVKPVPYPAGVYRTATRDEIVLWNGLVSRTFRLEPNAATVELTNLMTGAAITRGVKPEARLQLQGGEPIAVGGLLGQEEYGYLDPAWIPDFTSDPAAFQYAGLSVGPVTARFPWKRVRHAADLPWPPEGAVVTLHFDPPAGASPPVSGVRVHVHHATYQGLPLLGKWLTVENFGPTPVTLDRFTSEILAVVDHETVVNAQDARHARWSYPGLHVESDYAFLGMTPRSANVTTHWRPDPQYPTQVSFTNAAPLLLEVEPPVGPGVEVAPGETFETFRNWILVHDGTDRERRGLGVRQMYRTLAPWVTENPIFMHVRSADPARVQVAVDQCAEVGFEMVILTFGSGFNLEWVDEPEYVDEIREIVAYAHARGIEVGGYSLLASRTISEADDVVNPATGEPGGFAAFGNSPCLGSAWGRDYFRKLYKFYTETSMDMLEHDGSYPGDMCAATTHPGHRGLADSQWTQWRAITDFYKWCRGRGIYLNVPDWYFLSGSNKTGMGYKETNWSLPRARQVVLGRQNIYDGTWEKTPSMGWMFTPLVQYHGGGAAATLEPLREHLADYEAHLAQNFGAGVQSCYRGPRLYDAPETKQVVERWVQFFKAHRRILEADIVHVRRPDGRHLDCILHVDPRAPVGAPKGLAMIFNPRPEARREVVRVPLYYTGLEGSTRVQERDGVAREVSLRRDATVDLPVTVAPRGVTWFTFHQVQGSPTRPT